MCVCVCLCARARACVCVCVCVRERERETDREREELHYLKLHQERQDVILMSVPCVSAKHSIEEENIRNTHNIFHSRGSVRSGTLQEGVTLKKLGWEVRRSSGSSKCNLCTRIRGGLVLPYLLKSCVQLNAAVRTVHSQIMLNEVHVFSEVTVFHYLFVYLPFCASDFKYSDIAKRERKKVKICLILPKRERSAVQDLHSLSVAAAMLPNSIVTHSYYLFGTGYSL